MLYFKSKMNVSYSLIIDKISKNWPKIQLSTTKVPVSLFENIMKNTELIIIAINNF